jgi:endonuclease/exonuclease/phosphatase family metal-dependent hydrolase
VLRLITWNCRIGGFRYKSEYVAALRPDVLAVQEVEPLERVGKFGGEAQPTYRDRVHDPRYPKRAIGVFSYTGLNIHAVDMDAPLYAFRRYVASQRGLEFNIVATWTSATKVRQTSYRQAHEGVERHGDWIHGRPTIVMGDLNDNASFRGTRWTDFVALLQPFGLVSAYHAFHNEPFGEESRATYYHRGDAGSRWHIDYCFIPEAWVQHLIDVRVGAFTPEWKKVSDHVPLIVDLQI